MVDQSNAVDAAGTRSATPHERAQHIGGHDREGWEVVARTSTLGMSHAATGSAAEAFIMNPDVERAVAADEQRIAIELVGTVIRYLFGVGLTLSSVLPHVARPGEQPLNTAIDDVRVGELCWPLDRWHSRRRWISQVNLSPSHDVDVPSQPIQLGRDEHRSCRGRLLSKPFQYRRRRP